MASELGAYYIQIMPSLKGAKQQIESQLSGVDTQGVGSKLGKQMTTGISKGLSLDTVAQEFKNLGGELESVGASLTNSITKPFLVGATVAAGAAALIGKSALDAYADWEQLTGGVDTLFKDASQTVQKYAAGAYKTAGVSANQYMSQVTSFSASLIQSLGGDTAKAAEMGNMAIVDMADNANKMGSSLTDIQNAYQGFAKQNYTMLDNLKLGYGGTKSEMERLIADANRVKAANGEMADLSIESFADVVEAIHTVQTEMGITGTTALEAAETIEGSVASMKAAWSNWLAELGKDDADISGMTKALADSVVTSIENIAPRVKQIFESLVASIPEIWGALRSELPPVFDPLLDKVESVITWFSGLEDSTKRMMAGFAGAAVAAGPFLTIVGKLVTGAGGLVSGFGSVVEWVGKLAPAFTGAGGGAGGLLRVFSKFAGPVGIAVAAIATLWTQSDGFREAITNLAQQLIPVFQSVWDALVPVFQMVGEALGPIVAIVGETIGQIITLITPVIAFILAQLVPVIQNLAPVFEAAFAVVQAVVSTVMTAIQTVIAVVTAAIAGDWSGAWEALKAGFAVVWEGIKSIVLAAINLVKTYITSVLTAISTVWNNVWSAIGGFVSSVWAAINTVVSVAIGAVQSVISSVLASITGVWNSMWGAISNGISGIWSGITSGVQSGINTMMNVVQGVKGSITGFFSDAGSWLVDSGRAIIQGLVDGIKSMASSVTNAVGSVMNAARNLLPFSPAKEGPFSGRGWTLYSGQSIVEALAQGVTQKANLFSGAVADTMAAGQSAIGRLGSPGMSGRASLGTAYGQLATLQSLPDHLILRIGERDFKAFLVDETGAAGSTTSVLGAF